MRPLHGVVVRLYAFNRRRISFPNRILSFFFSVYDCYYKTFGKEKNGGGSILYYIIMPLYIDLIDLIDNQFFQGLEGRSLTCLQARLQAV